VRTFNSRTNYVNGNPSPEARGTPSCEERLSPALNLSAAGTRVLRPPHRSLTHNDSLLAKLPRTRRSVVPTTVDSTRTPLPIRVRRWRADKLTCPTHQDLSRPGLIFAICCSIPTYSLRCVDLFNALVNAVSGHPSSLPLLRKRERPGELARSPRCHQFG